MSLATRCPSCGTVFRVVQDQLRVSEGWVRCGRCNGVFDAAEVLFDIDSGVPVQIDLRPAGAAAAAPPPPQTPAPAQVTAALPAPPPAPAEWEVSAEADAAAPPWSGGRREPGFDQAPGAHALALEDIPLLRAPSRDGDLAEDGRAGPDLRSEAVDDIVITDHVPPPVPMRAPSPQRLADGPIEPSLDPMIAEPAGAAPGPAPALHLQAQALPSFMRTAERTALWRQPLVRAVTAVGVVALALALLAQLALLWRDPLAARWPAATPALNALCRPIGCSVQPPRSIDALSVQSSGLNRLEGSSLYRLQVVLHNGADTVVMMPALELSLTDAQGQLVARRVLPPAELGAPQPVLLAGEELPIKALLSTGERRVDGYTLELFYP